MTEHDRGAPAAANGMAIASLVLGIVSVLIVWIPVVGMLGTVMALVGLVLGILSLRKLEGRGLAIGGIVCAGVSLVITALYLMAFLAVIAAAAGQTG
jgi:uncharacterized membrane protein